jgi:hypothetical protein
MFSREQSLLSATYKKSLLPATALSVFQVSMCVIELRISGHRGRRFRLIADAVSG